MTEVPPTSPDGSYAPRRPKISFEFFPPKTEEMERTLWDSIERLAPLRPTFVSVTYGAGGSTRERTHTTVKRILAETTLIPAAHLTCVAATREDIDAVIASYGTAGVRHIVALRGDPAGGVGERYAPHPGGYLNAADLVAGIRRQCDAEISVSAYPEKHPDSPTVGADIDMLKAKVDAGATRAITQFFFDNELYFRYLDNVLARGIKIPIVPGILPVQNFKQTRGFAQRCGATIPAWLADRFAGLDEDVATRKLIAAANAQIKAGKLRALAVFAPARSPALPDVPTMKELGYDLEFYLWVGLFAPKGTPDQVIATLRPLTKQVAETEQFKTAMHNIGEEVAYLDQPEFAKFWDEDAKRVEEAVHLIGRVQG